MVFTPSRRFYKCPFTGLETVLLDTLITPKIILPSLPIFTGNFCAFTFREQRGKKFCSPLISISNELHNKQQIGLDRKCSLEKPVHDKGWCEYWHLVLCLKPLKLFAALADSTSVVLLARCTLTHCPVHTQCT